MADKLRILFDADMIVFRACSAVEEAINWGDDLWTLHADAGEAKGRIDDTVLTLTDKILSHYKHEGEYEILMCFSDNANNFRKAILPTYKLNRADKRKPVCYYGVKEWVEENYTCYQRPNLEADDCIGILATLNKNTVVISGDKDFKSIPCRFYDLIHNEFYDISVQEADYWHLYQTLVGDVADNYKGCPGLGAVGATKLLKENPTWNTVLGAFEKKGLTVEDALVQARVARILRATDYSFKKKEPILWNP